jgi:serine/threonine protein kinase
MLFAVACGCVLSWDTVSTPSRERKVSKPLKPGDQLGDYEIEAVAGVGGMGIVYRASQRSLERTVALKVIRDEIAEDLEYRKRFMREARLAASVDHPNVVTVYDVGSEDDRLYLAMQWIDGVDLKQQLAESGRLPPKRAVAIGAQLAGALDALHSVSGLIHRDVKPGNVLIREVEGTDHAYLTDFGIAKPPEGTENLTMTGSTLGTTGYLSPEQIQGRKSGPRSDLYALGCLTFESLTGEQPFEGENEMAVRWAHANDPRPLVSERVPALGHRYDQFFAVALAVDPDQRFASGREFAQALSDAQSGEGSTAETSVIAAPERAETKIGPPTPMPAQPAQGQTPPPGYHQYGYVTPPPQPQVSSKSGSPVALIALAIVAVAGLTVGVLAAAGVFSGGETKTITREAPKKNARAGAKKAKASAAPAGTTSCGGGVSVGPATTCPFALNVKEAFDESGGAATISAYSPVTERSYTMHCSGEGTHVCRGGNEATVYLTSSTTPAAAQTARAPAPASESAGAGLQACDENISASEATSCPFAENVFVSYWEDYSSYGEQSETYISAYSPTTGHSYGMSCTFDGITVECTGGNGAFVTFPMEAVRVY